jgi:hypothetical protein
MIRNVHPMFKKVVVVAGLVSGVLGIPGVARADDSSMNPFIGGSYAYFNGGHNLPYNGNPTFGEAPSAWRLSHPNGLPERMLQRDSSSAPAWQLHRPMFASASAATAFRRAHPNGLTERDLEALSSEAPAWQLRSGATTTSVASIEQGLIGQGATG